MPEPMSNNHRFLYALAALTLLANPLRAAGENTNAAVVVTESRHAAIPKNAPAASTPPAASSSVNIVFIGDSITYGAWLDGAGNAARIAQAPPMICAHELEKRMPSTHIYPSNQGYCGYGTGAFLPPVNEAFIAVKSAAEQLSAAHPGLLIFSIMLNDFIFSM